MTKLFISLQALLPQHTLSRLIGMLAQLERPLWLKNTLIKIFMRVYGISLLEAECEVATQFNHFNAFFTRSLKQDARPQGNAKLLSPADGCVSQRGAVTQGQLIQAKGHYYTAGALLADGTKDTLNPVFNEGSFATIYLSPKDYHRVHMPCSGTLRSTRYVPGALFAVNDSTAQNLPGLFAKNERLVCLFDTDEGPLAVVLVGAMIVAGIETVWGGVEEPAPGTVRERHWPSDAAPRFTAGDEIGRFFLGSTVIILSPKADLEWAVDTGATTRVKANLADYGTDQ